MHTLYFIFPLLLRTVLLPYLSPPGPPATVRVQITHHFGGQPLRLHQPYTTFHGEAVTFSKLKYYVSNVELLKSDGTVWQPPYPYWLVEVDEELPESAAILLTHVPPGEYVRIAFAIGVDSLRNHSGAQEGALNPDQGMFWMWETGYVFFKAEGMYQTSAGSRGALVFHIGRDQCYRKIRLPFPAGKLRLVADQTQTVALKADLKKLFGGFAGASAELKFPADNSAVRVMGGEIAAKAADNYAQLFELAAGRE
jgi:hypothetical protein